MIVDEILSRYPVLAPVASQGVVKVPFPVLPGEPTNHVPRGLVPMDRKGVLLGADVKAPWPVTVLAAEKPERGFLLVTSSGDEAGTDTISLTSFYLADSLTIAHFPGFTRTRDGRLYGPQWFASCLIWTAANHATMADWAQKSLRLAKEVQPGATVTRAEVESVIRARWQEEQALCQQIHGTSSTPKDPETLSDESLTELVGHFLYAAHSAMLASVSTFALFNTRNVVTRLVQPSSRAFIRRGERPPVAYHELVWRPFGTKAERINGSLYSGMAVAVNWARGHFKTYNSERPLFGQHVGRFWWQRHQRGLDKSHLVRTTYKVEIPSEVPA
jgi:hypothetical protein